MDPVAKTMSYFKERFSCAQSILAAFGESEGLAKETAFKLACGLGAGCSRTGQTCGAVSGAYLVLGLKFGKSTVDGDDAKEYTYELINEFNELFLTYYPSINCTSLLGADMSKPEGLKKARDEKIIENTCPPIIMRAAMILNQLLSEEL